MNGDKSSADRMVERTQADREIAGRPLETWLHTRSDALFVLFEELTAFADGDRYMSALAAAVVELEDLAEELGEVGIKIKRLPKIIKKLKESQEWLAERVEQLGDEAEQLVGKAEELKPSAELGEKEAPST